MENKPHDIVFKIKKIISEVTNIPTESIKENTMRDEIPGWDSLGHLNIIMEAERELGVNLTMEEVINIRSVQDLIETVKRKKESA